MLLSGLPLNSVLNKYVYLNLIAIHFAGWLLHIPERSVFYGQSWNNWVDNKNWMPRNVQNLKLKSSRTYFSCH